MTNIQTVDYKQNKHLDNTLNFRILREITTLSSKNNDTQSRV